jgi:hypothetical protein
MHETVNKAVGQGTDVLADRVERYASIANEVAGVLRQHGESQSARGVEMLGGKVRDVAAYLRDSDGSSLMHDVQASLRGRGWLLAGAGVAGGMALARAMRAGAAQAMPEDAQWKPEDPQWKPQGDYVETYGA